MTKIEKILEKIENFDRHFNNERCDFLYQKAWEINGFHRISLNQITQDSAEQIVNLIKEKKPKNIIEVGTGGAYSSIIMAEEAKKYGGRVTTFELSKPKYEIAKIHIEESELSNISLVFGNAKELLLNLEEKIDLLFLDANRKKYLEFLEISFDKLTLGSIVLADNVISHKEEITDFLNFFEKTEKFKSKIIETKKGLLVAEKII